MTTGQQWELLVKTALLGTERQSLPIKANQTAVGQLLMQIDSTLPEQQLLDAAGVMGLYQQVGQRPSPTTLVNPQPAPSETQLLCSPAAARMLGQLLASHYRSVLPEFLKLLAQANQRIPAELLPALLSHGRRARLIQPLTLPVIGARGRWLAQYNPNWVYATFEFANTEQLNHYWRTAERKDRYTLLNLLRHLYPDQARELLQQTWPSETPQERLQFIRLFKQNLSMADEPFLEEMVLPDRSQQIRQKAAELLAHLPQSRLCQRMAERTLPHLQWKWLTRSVAIVLPKETDTDLEQDGIVNKGLLSRLGKHSWRLMQMVASTPLEIWTQTYNTSAELFLTGVRKTKWQRSLMRGFATAAERQQNAEWAAAILRQNNLTTATNKTIIKLVRILPPPEREQLALSMLEGYGSQEKLHRHHPFIMILEHCDHEWSETLTWKLIEQLKQNLHSTDTANNRPEQMFQKLLRDFIMHIPPHMTPTVEQQLMPIAQKDIAWRPIVSELVSTLKFRQEMIQEILPPV